MTRPVRALGGLDLERIFVILVALHSLIIGLLLLLAPRWATTFGGWDHAEPLFFVRQGGAFHLVVVFAYLFEHYRSRTMVVLIFAKILAFVFLGACALLGSVPWAVGVSAVGDGLMAVAAVVLLRWSRQPNTSPSQEVPGTED